MTKLYKRFEQIMNNPKGVKWDEFKTILQHYGMAVKKPNASSHWKVYYEKDDQNRMFTIPVHNNNVKVAYVKKIIPIIMEYLEEMED